MPAMDGEAGFTFPPVTPSPPMSPRAGAGAAGDPRAPASPGALSPRSRLSRINKPSSSNANASPPASPELSIFELAELERKLVAGGSPVDRDAAAGTNASSSSTRLLDRERDSVLKSLSQILGEVANQVRDTDSRVAALEAANQAWKLRAERAEGRAGDLERKLDATREELLAMHDKTASKVAKIAAKDAAKSPRDADDSPRVNAMQREAESLDRYARETRAVVERLEAGAESLGREVRRLATGEARTREQLAERRNRSDEEIERRLASFESRLEATVTTVTTVPAQVDALRAEVTGAIAAAKDAAVERAVAVAERALVETAKGLKRERADEQSSLVSSLNAAVTQLDRSWRLELEHCRARSDAIKRECDAAIAQALERKRRDDSEAAELVSAKIRKCEDLCRSFIDAVAEGRRELASVLDEARVGERVASEASAAREAAERSTRAAEEASARVIEASTLADRVAASQAELERDARERIQDIERAVADTVDAVAEQLGGFKTTIEGRVDVMDAKAEECRERAEFASRCADHASAVSADAEVTAETARETAEAMGTGLLEARAVMQAYADAVQRAEAAAARCVGVVRTAVRDQIDFHAAMKTAVDDASTVGYAARSAAQEACESTADAGKLARVAVAEAMAEIRTDAKELASLVRKEKRAAAKATKLAKKDRELARETLRRAEERARSIEGKSIASAEERAKKAEARAKAEIADAVAERARLVASAEEKVKRTEAEARSRDVAAKKRLKDAEAKLEALAAERNDLTRQIAASSGAMAKAMVAMAERAGAGGGRGGVVSRGTPGSSAKGFTKGVSPARPRLPADDASPFSTRGFDRSLGVALPGMVEAAARLRAANVDQSQSQTQSQSQSQSQIDSPFGDVSASASAAYRLSVAGPISPASSSVFDRLSRTSPVASDGAARLRSLSASLREKSAEVERMRSAVSTAAAGLATSPAPVRRGGGGARGNSPGAGWEVSPVGAATSPPRHRPTLSIAPPAETIDDDAEAAKAEEETDVGRTVTNRYEPYTPAVESARKARASLDAAMSIVARLNSPPGESRDVVQPGESPPGESPPGHPRGLARSAMKPPPSPATRGAEAAGSEVARNFLRGARGSGNARGDPSSPVARGLAMFDSPA